MTAPANHPSNPDQLMARALGVCWHSPTSDRWPCTAERPMTAPAEDPRGGETPDLMAALIRSVERRPRPAAGRGDTDSGGEAIEPGFSAESNGRRLKWFTDDELAAELARRRALGGTT